MGKTQYASLLFSEYTVAMTVSSIFTVIWVFGAPLAAVLAVLRLRVPQIVAQNRLDALFQQFVYLYMTKARFQEVETKGLKPGQALYDMTDAQLLTMFHTMEGTLNSKSANDFLLNVFGNMDEEELWAEFQKLDLDGSGSLDMAEVQDFLKSRGHVGKGELLLKDVHSSKLTNWDRIEMSSIHMALASAPWQEHLQDLGAPQLNMSLMDAPVQSEDPEAVEIDFEQFKQLVRGSQRSKPLAKAIFKPWVVHFDIGGVHMYTDAQIREKFGVTEVVPNMTVQHAVRGPGCLLPQRLSPGEEASILTGKETAEQMREKLLVWTEHAMEKMLHSQLIYMPVLRWNPKGAHGEARAIRLMGGFFMSLQPPYWWFGLYDTVITCCVLSSLAQR